MRINKGFQPPKAADVAGFASTIEKCGKSIFNYYLMMYVIKFQCFIMAMMGLVIVGKMLF